MFFKLVFYGFTEKKIQGRFASGVHNVSQRPVTFNQARIAKLTFLSIKEYAKLELRL